MGVETSPQSSSANPDLSSSILQQHLMSTPETQSSLPRPLVITSITLPGLLEYSLSLPAHAHLIICTSRPLFLQRLYASIDINDPLLTPTLKQLSTSSTVSTAFCPTLQTLQAYLSTIPTPLPSTEQAIPHPNTLILVYLLSLHIESATHSAQGLSRTLASAIDASIRAKAHLIIAEPLADNDEAAAMGLQPQDPWDDHMPILNNTSTRSRLEQRGWVGRTVTGRTVAQRWFRFSSLADLTSRKGP